MTGELAVPPLRSRSLPPVAAIDRAIFGPGPFAMSDVDRVDLQIGLISEAAAHHVEHCDVFGRYCEAVGFDPAGLRDEADLGRVPQIPASFFKRATVRSETEDGEPRRCTSSGTRGSLSVVWRDRQTIQRLFGSIRAGIAEFLGDPLEQEAIVINLGPSQDEVGDLWFSYVMSLVELGYETRHMVKDGVFDATAATAAIRAAGEEASMVVVLGSPAMVREVACAASSGLAAGPSAARIVVLTAGGWKRLEGEEISRPELTGLLVEAFGIADESDVRDAFNQVELNTVLFECEAGEKHLPPWLHAFTRDARTMEPGEDGTLGLLSYLDPSAQSYPAFIVSDDWGVVRGPGCRCGRPGKRLSLLRRVERSEHWGCALKIESAVAIPAAGGGS